MIKKIQDTTDLKGTVFDDENTAKVQHVLQAQHASSGTTRTMTQSTVHHIEYSNEKCTKLNKVNEGHSCCLLLS